MKIGEQVNFVLRHDSQHGYAWRVVSFDQETVCVATEEVNGVGELAHELHWVSPGCVWSVHDVPVDVVRVNSSDPRD